MLRDKTYKIIKNMVLWNSAIATFIGAIWAIWKIPYQSEVVLTITAIGTLLSGILEVSTIIYNKKRNKPASIYPSQFIPRTEIPDNEDPYYTRKKFGGYNPCIAGNTKYLDELWEGCVIPNCVGYATGRFNEIGQYGKCKYLGNRNAKNFIALAESQGLEISDTPSIGACMVWNSSNCGHVAIVEKVIDENTIITSESGWGYRKYYMRNVTRMVANNWGMGSSYPFLGFIVNPAIEEEPQPEPEPTPEYKQWKQGDLVSLKEGSFVYGTEKCFSDWVYNYDLVVVEDSCEDRTVIGKSIDEVTGACYSNDLEKREDEEPIEPNPEQKESIIGNLIIILLKLIRKLFYKNTNN